MNTPRSRVGRIVASLAAIAIAAATVTMLAPGRSMAQQVKTTPTPTAAPLVQYDIDGAWKADATRQLQCFRNDTDVTCVMANANYNHKFNLVYTSPTKLEGVVTRRNRTKPCVTHLGITITMTSATVFSLTWKALDSNCDLTTGQSASDPAYARVL
jgi:hypothetical protein